MGELEYTIGEMYRLADKYTGDVERYDLHTVDQIFNAARRIPYVSDLGSCGEEECLKRPAYGYWEGDCDDKAIFSGAALRRIGVPFRFVTVAFSPTAEMSHVYLEIYRGGKWLPFDPTYIQNSLYRESPYAQKIVWPNPMLTRQYGVATLEGVGQVTEAIAIVGNLKTVLSSIQNILVNVPIIGGLFRGSTQHIDEDTAVAKQKEVGDNAIRLYDALDDNGKSLMAAQAKSFFVNYILPGWGNWWDNAINNNYQKQLAAGNVFNTQRMATWHYIADPVYYFLRLEDSTRVQDSLNSWYTGPVQSRVFDPINAYVQTKYGMTAQQLEQQYQAHTGGGISTASLGDPKTLLLIGVGALLLFGMGKRGSGGRRRRVSH